MMRMKTRLVPGLNHGMPVVCGKNGVSALSLANFNKQQIPWPQNMRFAHTTPEVRYKYTAKKEWTTSEV
jgi:hypothetical protein